MGISPCPPSRLGRCCAFPTRQLRAGTRRENPGAEQTKGASSAELRETGARYRAVENREWPGLLDGGLLSPGKHTCPPR